MNLFQLALIIFVFSKITYCQSETMLAIDPQEIPHVRTSYDLKTMIENESFRHELQKLAEIESDEAHTYEVSKLYFRYRIGSLPRSQKNEAIKTLNSVSLGKIPNSCYFPDQKKIIIWEIEKDCPSYYFLTLAVTPHTLVEKTSGFSVQNIIKDVTTL